MAYVTLKDIAKKAGVSKAVVSYVLNRKEKKYRIAPETCEKVRRIAEEANYIPHLAASGFRLGRTKIIGLIVQDISYPFYSEVAKGVSDYAHRNNFNVIYGSSYEDLEREKELVYSLMAQRVDGIILLPLSVSAADYLEIVKDRGVPIVLFQKALKKSPFPSATFDDFKGTYIATEYLIKLGHSAIGFCGTRNEIEMVRIIEQSREQGFQQALIDYGLKPSKARIFRFTDYVRDVMVKQVRRFLTRKNLPRALICLSDHIAAEIMIAAREKGIEIPRDMSIMGNNDMEICTYLTPKLSTVHFPRYRVGELLTEILLEQIKAKKRKKETPLRHELLMPSLVIRDSCSPPCR